MSKEDNIWFLATLTVGIVLGGVLGLWFTEFRPDQTLIYDYQALIAGTLALAAGLMTVFQMARVDIRQAERQRELMSIQLRKDALILDRYRFNLSIGLKQSAQFVAKMRRSSSDIQSALGALKLRNLSTEFSEMTLPNERPGFTEASNLLSAEFHNILDELTQIQNIADQAFKSLFLPDGFIAAPEIAQIPSIISIAESFQLCERALYEHVSDLRRKYVKATGLPLKDISYTGVYIRQKE